MQLRSCVFILAVPVLCASLAACSRSEQSAAEVPKTDRTAPASAPVGAAIAYEVVTVERPESVAEYHKLYQATYEMCAATRSNLKMAPPPPMKQPPADFIVSRTTHTSDGSAYLVKEEYFTYKVDMVEPSFTCNTVEERTSSTQLVRDGKVYDAAVDEAGKRSSEPAREWDLPRASKESVYTEAKTVKGQAVRCMKMLPNTQELITELCIADLKPGTLADAAGEPIVLASRVTSSAPIMSAILTEPVSVKVGQKIDKTVFDAAAAP